MDFDPTRGDLAEGLQRYEAGAFFSAHEAWEDVWLQSQEPDKTFVQALIQLTAARHHLRRLLSALAYYRIEDGAMLDLVRAATRISPISCTVQGYYLGRPAAMFVDETQAALIRARLRPEHRTEFFL